MSAIATYLGMSVSLPRDLFSAALLTVALSGVLGAAGAWIVASVGPSWGLTDHPSERSSHRFATPKGGGIGLAVTLCIVAAMVGFPIWVAVPAAALAALSFAGDRADISPALRLIAHFLMAAFVSYALLRSASFVEAVSIPFAVVAVPLASGFLVATANTYNFMDGINGLAAITGMVAFGLLAMTGAMRAEPHAWVLLAAALAAACAGFLPFNIPVARVFMGDVGSILLGFVFGVYVVAWSRSLADLVMFASFLLPFYVDETATLFVRFQQGDALTKPHRRHVYQILANSRSIAHWKISVAYGLVQCVSGALFLFFRRFGLIAELGLGAAMVTALWGVAARIRTYEVTEPLSSPRNAPTRNDRDEAHSGNGAWP